MTVFKLTGLMDANWKQIKTFAAEQSSGRAFGVSASLNATPAGTEVRFLYMLNPAASGKVVSLDQFSASINDTGLSDSVLFRFYLNPTPSAVGTKTTPSNLLGGGPAASCLAYTKPTVADASRGLILPFLAHPHYASPADRFDFRCFALNPGDRLLVTGTPSGTNIVSVLGLSFFEGVAAA